MQGFGPLYFPDTVAKCIGKETLLTRWYGFRKGIKLYFVL